MTRNKMIKLQNFRTQIKEGFNSLTHRLLDPIEVKNKVEAINDVRLQTKLNKLNLKGTSISRTGSKIL